MQYAIYPFVQGGDPLLDRLGTKPSKSGMSRSICG
jgi:hypothetical protein